MGITRAVALTTVGAVFIIAGVACMFWQLALVLAGTFLALAGLFGVDVKEGR